MTVTEASAQQEEATTEEQRRPLSNKLLEATDNAGHMLRFSWLAIRSLSQCRLYVSEVIRQTGILIFSSGLVILGMELVMGGVFAVASHYISTQMGVRSYSAMFVAYGCMRGFAPLMWGWILSAKVSCGLVAEIGSMRITEEIDALEVMGIRPRPYLVGTRILAAWIAIPFLYAVGIVLLYAGAFFMNVVVLQTVSEGGFISVLWTYQNPLDLLFSLIWAMATSTAVVLVGCYYGYNASGGPVGVGLGTAKSMVVNMVVVSFIGLVAQQAFWGGFPNAPISN